eukprot:scaffold4742_cov149-Skeletonema_menzelii.AAC.5
MSVDAASLFSTQADRYVGVLRCLPIIVDEVMKYSLVNFDRQNLISAISSLVGVGLSSLSM